jgi:serine phosphatase RsbU (regulator of sigma subunit)
VVDLVIEHASASAHEISERIVDAWKGFTKGHIEDDLIIIVVKRKV